MEIVLIQKI